MESNEWLMWWRTIHSCNAMVGWIVNFLGIATLVLMYLRIQATFLLVFVAACLVYIVPRVLDPMFSASPDRPYEIGVLIDGLWMLGYITDITAAIMCSAKQE